MDIKKTIIIILTTAILVICTVSFKIAYNNHNSKSYSSEGGSAKEVSSQYESITSDNAVTLTTEKIVKGGSYVISDSSDPVTIDTDEDVVLTLNNATIKASDGPAINVINAKSVTVIIEGENVISASVSEEADGAIYSSDDLVFKGDGILNVTSNIDGIVSKDSLIIMSGTYNITSSDDAIRGKDYVAIVDGTFYINAGGDAIKSNNEDDENLGYIVIDNGTFNIKCSKDGMDAVSYITINNGNITIDSDDDAIHSDGLLNIKDGTINISAHEGLEATYVKIDGGTININASDDGINAGNKTSKYKVLVEINGGDITINMGQGDTDGVDSNGDIVINGGTISVTGQSTFDYDGSGTINGGTVICNGEKVSTLPNQFMGGGQPGMMGGDPRRMR